MGKYIIELEDSESVYKTIIANGYPMLQVIVPAPYTEPDMEQVRKEAYENGYENGFVAGHLKAEKSGQSFYEDGYQRGLNDAWEAAKKIALMDTETSENVTGYFGLFRIMENLTPMQAIKKIRQYEQKQEEIQVGDEIIRSNGEKYVVLIVDNEKNLVTLLRHDGYKRTIESKWVTKTGRHFPEIAEVLRKMRGEE